MSALGRVFGPLASGAMFDVNMGMPFYAAAALTFIGLILSLGLGVVTRKPAPV